MKRIFSQVEYITMIIILVLSFFPWGGVFGSATGMDIAMNVAKNLSGSIADYLTFATIVLAALALILAQINKASSLVVLLALASPITLFVYKMIDTKGDFVSSIELAYGIVLILSILVLLKHVGIIKFKFLK